MRILIDMNLSPAWVHFLDREGMQAEHWSTLGNPAAPDSELFHWAGEHGYTIMTCDLGFGSQLADTRLQSPSVIQLRVDDVSPEALGSRVIELLDVYASHLEEGAIITVEESGPRVRSLPIN